jgi:hypothetical protein
MASQLSEVLTAAAVVAALALVGPQSARAQSGYPNGYDPESGWNWARDFRYNSATHPFGYQGSNWASPSYPYGSVLIERSHVRALQASSVTQIGNQTYCYLALDGKAVRTPVRTGVSDGTWVKVTGKLVRSAGSSDGTWEAFDGSEAVVDGDLSEISDGVPVQVEPGH